MLMTFMKLEFRASRTGSWDMDGRTGWRGMGKGVFVDVASKARIA